MSEATKELVEVADMLRHHWYANVINESTDIVRLNSQLRAFEEILSDNDLALSYLERIKYLVSELEDRVSLRLDAEDAWHAKIMKARAQCEVYVQGLKEQVKQCEAHPINSPEVRSKVWAMTGGKCAYCGCELTQGDHESRGTSFSVEHVVPRQHGGPDNLANYVPSCASCNSSKSTDHVLTFINRNIERRISSRVALRVVNSDVAGDE